MTLGLKAQHRQIASADFAEQRTCQGDQRQLQFFGHVLLLLWVTGLGRRRGGQFRVSSLVVQAQAVGRQMGDGQSCRCQFL